MSQKKTIIIGAGPGGLTCGMLLAANGHAVELYEKESVVGGRNAAIKAEGYTFDVGPTFLMMLWILEEMFELSHRKIEDYLDIKRIDPMYRLKFGDGREFYPSGDHDRMKEELERVFPGSHAGYQDYMDYESKKLKKIVPCLQVPYEKYGDYLTKRFLSALPVLDAHKSLYNHLGNYFKEEELKLSFTFQAKYLGMSPWKCPATFSIISFLEHNGGIYHPIGGLNAISHAMAKVIEEEGGTIHLDKPVDKVLVRKGKAVGIRLMSGEEIPADDVVVNADFGHAVNHLFPRDALRKWTPEALERKEISCSGYMLYLGVKKQYPDMPHHSIIFSPDYEGNVREIADTLRLSEDPSIYVQNASVTDPTLAPEGCSTIYILVPIANNRSGIAWEKEKDRYRDKVLELAETRGGYEGLRDNIVVERMLTPLDFEKKLNVYRGAVFNLGHTIRQMLLWRPHNRFEEIENCYLVGGGTHPGSGLPTIYESGRISAGLIMKKNAWFNT